MASLAIEACALSYPWVVSKGLEIGVIFGPFLSWLRGIDFSDLPLNVGSDWEAQNNVLAVGRKVDNGVMGAFHRCFMFTSA